MKVIAWVAVCTLLAACGSKKDDGVQTTVGSAGSGVPIASDAPAPDAPGPVAGPAPRNVDPACANTCNEAQDCPASQCDCEDGTSVTARSCVNGCCQDMTATCGGTCDEHDGMKGTWNAAREGGLQTGKACSADDDCAKKLCYRGYCSRSCQSESECPPFWECEEVGRTSDKLCVRR